MSITASVTEFSSKHIEGKPLSACTLSLVVLENRVEFAVTAPTGLVVLLGQHGFLAGQTMAQGLDQALTTNPKLTQPFAKVDVRFAVSEWALIPQEYLKAENLTDAKFLETLHEVTADSYLYESQPNKDTGMNVAFAYPKALKPVLDNQLRKAEIGHVVFPLLQVSRQLHASFKAPLSVHIALMGDRFLLVLQQNSGLLFCNLFEAAYAEDVLYYTLSILQSFNVPPARALLYITGRAEFAETLKQVLAPHIPNQANARSKFRAHPEMNPMGRFTDELSYMGAEVLEG